MFRLLPETRDDAYEVEMLYDLAFAPGRGALSSYKLREGVAPVGPLCTVARDEFDSLVGAIRFWPVRIGGATALLLGPIAVHPTYQGEGLGARLIATGLDQAREAGWQRVVLVGDPPYYGRFGFEAAIPLGISFPPPVNPDRVLILELQPGAFREVSGEVTPWSC
ncbi:MAG: N-acetyltransferase [Pseudomonadota bacterium]